MVDVGIEWINNFPAPCTQNTLSYCDETSVGFLNGIGGPGTRYRLEPDTVAEVLART